MTLNAPLLALCLLLSLCACAAAAAPAADDQPAGAPATQTGTSAAAAEPLDQILGAAATEQGSGWLFGGGIADTDPGYVGYSRQLTPLPLVFYHYDRFFLAGISAGYLLSNGAHYRFSLVAQPQINRLSAHDSPQLAGIQNRPWSIDGGVNLDFFGGWGRYNIGVLHDLLDRNNGAAINTGYHYPLQAGAWTLTPGIGLRWESSNLTNYYYGVSPAEAIPGRPPYTPGSATNPFVDFGVATPIGKHWQFRGSLQYLRFDGAIRDSPIVDRSGSQTIFVGFLYRPRIQ